MTMKLIAGKSEHILTGSFANFPICTVVTDNTPGSSTERPSSWRLPPAVQQAQQLVAHLLPQVRGHRIQLARGTLRFTQAFSMHQGQVAHSRGKFHTSLNLHQPW